MKKRLRNTNVKNKTVILRIDYNVPLKNQEILDDSKIKISLETINYLLSQNTKIIILSHLGKVKSEADKYKYSLEPIAKRLSELISRQVFFSKEIIGNELVERVSKLNYGDILMLENTRFMDLQGKMESNCDIQLSMFWANLGDVFVNDAFATAHRKHASTYGIATQMPNCIGFIMEKEIEMLDKLILHNQKELTIVMGGAKVDDKIVLIEKLLPKCKYFLCGGAIANTCLKALDINVGASLVSNNEFVVNRLKNIMLANKEKIMMPLDVIVGSTYDQNYVRYKAITEIDINEIILDIGTKTLEKFQSAVADSQNIFLNGPMGMYEDIRYANGTKEFFKILANSKADVIVGGGDSVSSVYNLGYKDSFTYVSSGGGATLEYISTEDLIALEPIEEESEGGNDVEILDM